MQISLPAGGTRTNSAASGTTVTQNKSPDLGLIRGVVGDILGNQAKGIEYDAAGAGQRMSAAGYGAEIASYGSSENIANLYSAYAKATGDIQGIQAQREASQAAGGQRAAVAGSGFSDDADIVRSTMQRGYLADQIVRTQSNFDQAGYLEQASASQAQANAAGVAQGSALQLGSVYDNAALQARTYAANATTGLSDYLSKFNLQNTTAQGLTSGQDVGTEIATAPKVSSSSTTGSNVTGAPVNQFDTHAGVSIGSAGSQFGGFNAWQTPNPEFSAGLSPQQSAVLGGNGGIKSNFGGL